MCEGERIVALVQALEDVCDMSERGEKIQACECLHDRARAVIDDARAAFQWDAALAGVVSATAPRVCSYCRAAIGAETILLARTAPYRTEVWYFCGSACCTHAVVAGVVGCA